jgi:hypothetical protein
VIWPERAWWTGQKTFWSQQPVAHALGGLLGAVGVLFVMAAPWWARPTAVVGGLGAYWQLRVWEPQPDGTYPLRWVAYDVLVNVLFALFATGIAVALGVRW